MVYRALYLLNARIWFVFHFFALASPHLESALVEHYKTIKEYFQTRSVRVVSTNDSLLHNKGYLCQ